MMTVHHGSDTSYPLHPEHQSAIKKLRPGMKTTFKDETNSTVHAHREGDTVHLTRPKSGSTLTSLPYHHFDTSEHAKPATKKPAGEYDRKVTDHLKKKYNEENMVETKGAPKGFHFTKDGKLKRGDANQDGNGGPMLRSDPLDKQRNKVPAVSERVEQMDESHLNMAKNAKTEEEFHSHMLDHHMQMMHAHKALDDSYASERHADKAKQHADKLSKLGNDVTFNEETISEKITVVQGAAPAGHNNKPTTTAGITSGTVYTGGPAKKPATAKPNRINTQARPSSTGVKPNVPSTLSRVRLGMTKTNEGLDFAAIWNGIKPVHEEVKTTHEDPLVVTKDAEGHIHTHANLSVANAIHGTDVKHQAIHTGKPVQGGKFTFELSKHHEGALKEDAPFDPVAHKKEHDRLMGKHIEAHKAVSKAFADMKAQGKSPRFDIPENDKLNAIKKEIAAHKAKVPAGPAPRPGSAAEYYASKKPGEYTGD
jgi:hypothetical protein